ncbi:glycoside hydrolase family 5 protein [Atractiella rhizophila]|nr:glycoside hydrolase family 5 protein [Atractiella rhizophila]
MSAHESQPLHYNPSTPGDSTYGGGPGGGSTTGMKLYNSQGKEETGLVTGQNVARKSNKKLWIIAGVLLVVAAAVAIPVGIVVSNNNKSSSKNNSGSSNEGSGGNNGHGGSSGNGTSSTFAATNPSVKSGAWRGTGTDNSEMIMDDGSSFVYVNNYGGTWDAVPFSNTARAQADVPALNETWYFSLYLFLCHTEASIAQGLGGWINIEPFIVPGLFEPYENSNPAAVDEWTLSTILGERKAQVIEEHYNTFITEKDIADIAAAGLNWVRIPIPWWVIETWDGEPFLERVGWKYVLKGFEWCRKYGIRVNLDLHAVPGSQNGNNHSGRLGNVNFLMGVMGIANAQRRPQYTQLIPIFSVLNEPKADMIGTQVMKQFHLSTYKMVRDITGFGAGNGPAYVIDRGFVGQDDWFGFLDGGDRVFLDHHPYFAFTPDIINQNLTLEQYANLPCVTWGNLYNDTFTRFGFGFVGEMSLAINDCGKYINNVGQGTRYEATLSSSPSSIMRWLGQLPGLF